MIKAIYVTGDSFSFGQELGGSDISVEDFYIFTPYMRQYSYTGIIANNWKTEFYQNTSKPGGSNDRIHRKIMFDIPQLLQKYKSNEIFVFISITHAARREFFDSRMKKYSPYINNHEPPKENILNHSLWKCYTSGFDDSFENCQRYVMQVLSIQSFLNNLGVEFLITNSMNESEDFREQFNRLPAEMINLIDRKHYPSIMPFNAYAGTLKLPFGKHKHPLEDGHSAWARYLTEYMSINNIGQVI
jgi:hypothetical protein